MNRLRCAHFAYATAWVAMRESLNTVSIKLRTVESFKNQVGFVRLHRVGEKSRQVDAACGNLETAVRRLSELVSEVTRLQAASPKGEMVKKWRLALRNRSLLALAPNAKAHLGLKLKVPHKEASNAEYIKAGEQFATALRPHWAALVANGMDDDCLDVLENSTAKLRYWTTEQSTVARRLREAQREEKAAMTRARLLARSLNGVMVAFCEDNRHLLGGWNEARRVPKRIGQKRGVGGHLKSEARKAKRDRSPKGRPADWDQPLEKSHQAEATPEQPQERPE